MNPGNLGSANESQSFTRSIISSFSYSTWFALLGFTVLLRLGSQLSRLGSQVLNKYCRLPDLN